MLIIGTCPDDLNERSTSTVKIAVTQKIVSKRQLYVPYTDALVRFPSLDVELANHCTFERPIGFLSSIGEFDLGIIQ